ncbi:uncharacterized protein M421DRAFT_418278 [Didymella exigua CBS 183.55]|uniref:Uncharacterized protein n=1 Tax=Didymella exigua CBS 183.55 TaxID=1150837 RepID=A0A6A5RTD1_9PLEO|nr:uncharacterized protein M421DRAFT_418278 [Didymella exigua CBS 183.55]KAF1930799.1 hypothetical protein M421DRAFT_418278 [Didymella exigua CBS 183.55]
MNRALCTFGAMDGSMKQPRRLQSLQPAHHHHDGTRPGANELLPMTRLRRSAL